MWSFYLEYTSKKLKNLEDIALNQEEALQQETKEK